MRSLIRRLSGHPSAAAATIRSPRSPAPSSASRSRSRPRSPSGAASSRPSGPATGPRVSAPDPSVAAAEVRRFANAACRSARPTTCAISPGTSTRARSTPKRGAALDDDALIAALVEVKGIGRWTAEMFLMFHELRADILPVDDIGLQNAIALHYHDGARPMPRPMRDLATRGARTAASRRGTCGARSTRSQCSIESAHVLHCTLTVLARQVRLAHPFWIIDERIVPRPLRRPAGAGPIAVRIRRSRRPRVPSSRATDRAPTSSIATSASPRQPAAASAPSTSARSCRSGMPPAGTGTT